MKANKRIVYGLIMLFTLVFIIGLLELGGTVLLINATLFLLLGVYLLIRTYQSKVSGHLKIFLMITGFSAILFSIGLGYGVFGIWSYYSINDTVFLSAVGLSWLSFTIFTIGSLLLFRKEHES